MRCQFLALSSLLTVAVVATDISVNPTVATSKPRHRKRQHHHRTTHTGPLGTAASPLHSLAAPSSLTVTLVHSPAASQLVVSGTNGGFYGLSVTADLKSWINSDAELASADGKVTFPIVLDSNHLLYRAYSAQPPSIDADPPEVAIGERLFLETRFAQFFAAHNDGVNAPLKDGDLVMQKSVTLTDPVPGPFVGQSMNCRACHLVDEQNTGLGNRTYADFARRSPIPDRGDGRTTTPRNSPPMVNASITRPVGFFLHFDAEFPDGKSLVKAAFTGRNFGWLATERDAAIKQIAKVIREDDGSAYLGSDFGGSYPAVFLGMDPSIPGDFRLPAEYRLDVSAATDDEIVDLVARLVNAYTESLEFVTNDDGEYDTSPYDFFLKRNSLPRKPNQDEASIDYGKRLLALLNDLKSPTFVTSADGAFTTHTQEFKFGADELAGLKIFLTQTAASPVTGGVGNCVACHAPPNFTDFGFHNTGAAQQEYDAIHGLGAFAQITIPDLVTRSASPEEFLPSTGAHPNAKDRFRSPPSAAKPGYTDLGVWNIFANSDFPPVQQALNSHLGQQFSLGTPELLLPKTVALFKTPGLRDLGQSAPYLHTGQMDTLGDLLRFYRTSGELARAGQMRNADPEIARISINDGDSVALAAFLNALNEDYE